MKSVMYKGQKYVLAAESFDPMVFNRSLGNIGGNTGCFLSADKLKEFKEEIILVPELAQLASETVELEREWVKVKNAYSKQAQELRDRIRTVFKEKIPQIKYL